MMRVLLIGGVLLAVPAFAGTTVYTDVQHPPSNLEPDTQVVLLDGPQQLQDALFGRLPDNPELAAQQAQAVLQSPQWPAQERQLAERYRQVVQAWELGVEKYPAVVFDGRDVVYGTADVAQARRLQVQGGRP